MQYKDRPRGLSSAEVRISRSKHGSNVMSKKKREGFFKKLLKNLGDPVIKILLGALVINLIFMFKSANYIECIGIAVSVFLATFISTLSECGSERAFDHLTGVGDMQKVRALRDGEISAVDISDVVVGDIIMLSAGEMICADGEIIDGSLTVDTSSMTGESREFEKRVRMRDDADDDTPHSPYRVHRGSTIMSGEGIMRTCAVGDKTSLGKICEEIQTEQRESPLKIRLARLASQISRLGYIAAFCIAFIYLFNIFVIDSGFDIGIIKYKLTDLEFLLSSFFGALTLGLTVIVVAVPEGLPMMISVVLSSNTKRMLKDKVLVKKPVGIESAGSMNILFCDKTGTLTEGVMSVGDIYTGNGERYSGASDLLSRAEKIYESYFYGSVLNTSAVIGVENGKRCPLGGNAAERALAESVIHSRALSMPHTDVRRVPFDSKRKYSYACADLGHGRIIMIKGAPDILMPHAVQYMDARGDRVRLERGRMTDILDELTASGKRVLMISECTDMSGMEKLERGIIPDLCLICFVLLSDRVRREASGSVQKLKDAGIQTVMITGDNKQTAKSIALSCGICNNDNDIVISSAEMSRMSDIELKAILPRLSVVARALPTDKSRLVRIAGELDLVVGMTGDGINDAPALKAADVGFAMGSGTQVAKDAGDIVILDDDLSSVVKAVHYGRNIFKSIRKFISLQLLMNFCAVGVSVICPFLGIDSPVTVVQMLWINIIMDTLGGLAFAGEAPLDSDMKERPKRRDEPILNGYMINEILLSGSATIALCICFLKIPRITGMYRYAPDNIYLLSAFFALFIFASVFNCFGCRTDRLKLFSNLSGNRGFVFIMSLVLVIQILFVYLGGQALRTAPLTLRELLCVFLLSLTVIPAEFCRKLLYRCFFGKKGY